MQESIKNKNDSQNLKKKDYFNEEAVDLPLN